MKCSGRLLRTLPVVAVVCAMAGAGLAAETDASPASGGSDKILIFAPRTRDLGEFEKLARAAKKSGFTHVVISELSGRTDLQGLDKDSPWCEWSTIMPSLFKHVTPPGMEAAFPKAFVEREMAFLKAKHDIAAKVGLRCAYFGVEPVWLSEAVFLEHPTWRGTRADNSLRTTGMFFAANTDHPEVRACYREAMRRLCKECPGLDVFRFVTNDSGAFYPWASRAFVNPNGPTGYENRDIGDRVMGFLAELRAGALASGVDAHVYTECQFTPEEMHSLRHNLRPGVGIAQHAPEPFTRDGSLGTYDGWGGGIWMPMPLVKRLPTPGSVLAFANAVRQSPVRRLMTGGDSMDFFIALEAALKEPPANGVRARWDVLHDMAEAVYAPDVADGILDAWNQLERADLTMEVGGVGMLSGPVLGRWLVRPLVAYPERLTEDERAYWEPHLYQSRQAQPDTYLDYLTIVGYPVARSWEEATRTCLAVDRAEGILAEAARQLDGAAARTGSETARVKLTLDAQRVRALRCVALTVRHYLQVGSLIRQRDLDNAAQPKTTKAEPISPNMPKGDAGSEGLFFMHRTLRWELDNTYELIGLLEKAGEPLIFTEADDANEGSLFYGPDLLDGLRRKVAIMLKYWRTAEEGYYLPTKGG